MTFCRPINGPNTPGWRITTNYWSGHKGKDYAAPEGTPVYAKQDGTIHILQQNETRQWLANTPSDPFPYPRTLNNTDYGNCIITYHKEGFMSLNAHLKYGSIIVKEGQEVKKGQKIGAIGSTGNSTGNHTHDELRLYGNYVDLAFYFDSSFIDYFDGQTAPPLTDQQKVNKIREILASPLIGDGQKLIEIRKVIG